MREFVDPSSGIAHFDFDDVGSTNDEVLRLANERNLDFVLVTAKRQLQGRGRRGRTWISEAGNLYCSVFLRQPAEASQCAQLSFVAAIALRAAILDVTKAKAEHCELKWPNDLLWRGAKVAGLLLEAHSSDGAMNVVIGMGTNCAHHPDNTPYPATDLQTEGMDVAPDDLFLALKRHLQSAVNTWDRGRGFNVIRQEWLTHAAGIGKEIIVRLQDDELHGTFKTLDHEGYLILSHSRGRESKISAGDVFFPSAAR